MAEFSESTLRAIRAEFPPLARYIWMQQGGIGLVPGTVHEYHRAQLAEWQEAGPLPILQPERAAALASQSRVTLAEFLGGAPAELAFLRGVSEAYQTVLLGLTWRRGDRLLLSAEEMASLRFPSQRLRQEAGVEVDRFPLLADESAQLAAIAERVTPRTRLIAFSQVTMERGWRTPARAICELAREKGVLSFLDCGHSAGLLPLPLRDTGADFAGVINYKWMYSPYASGALYIRRERLEALGGAFGGGRYARNYDFASDRFTLSDSAERYQHGPLSWPLVHSWARAAQWLSDIGRAAIYQRTLALTTRLKEGLARIPEITLHTPRAPERSAALVAFDLAGWRGAELAAALRERQGIIARALFQKHEGLRVSLPFFTLDSEIEELLSALREYAKAPAPAT